MKKGFWFNRNEVTTNVVSLVALCCDCLGRSSRIHLNHFREVTVGWANVMRAEMFKL